MLGFSSWVVIFDPLLVHSTHKVRWTIGHGTKLRRCVPCFMNWHTYKINRKKGQVPMLGYGVRVLQEGLFGSTGL